MGSEGAIAARVAWQPRLAGAAGWALLGVAAILLGWPAADWLSSQGLDVEWTIGPVHVGVLFLFIGVLYSGMLGIAVWRRVHAGWLRAAGFVLVSMFWFDFGWNAAEKASWFNSGIDVFLILFAGFMVATVWMTLAGLLFLPALRSRMAVAWPLGAGAGFAALAGAIAIPDFFGVLDVVRYFIAGWCAVYAAALSMGLPQAPRTGGDDARGATQGRTDTAGPGM